MGYISIEWGLTKFLIIIFSLIFIIIGIYPFLIEYNLIQLPELTDKVLHILLIVLGLVQLVLLGFKIKRPKID